MKRFFFKPSRDAKRLIEDGFHFMWPAAAAMWNMRWQVNGFCSIHPGWTEADLQSRFVLGSGINGASIEKSCLSITWDENQEKFAQFLLFQTFGVYEHWIAEVLELLGVHSKATEKELQFPSDPVKKRGISYRIAALTAHKSKVLEETFHSQVSFAVVYSAKILENLMLCYRFFKESRNDYAHHGGVCSPETLAAWTEFKTIATAAELGVNEIPFTGPVVEGCSLKLSLRGCVGFTDVIYKLIAILDFELSRAIKAETVIIEDLSLRKSRNWKMLPADKAKRMHRIETKLFGLGYPKVTVPESFAELLKMRGVIFY